MTKASTGRDFVTVLRIDGDRANKLVMRETDGSISKLGAVEGGVYVAQTFHVPDAAAFADLLRQVGEDPRLVISLGIFKDAGEGVFHIWPRKRIARALGLNPAAMSQRELKEKTKGWHEVGGQRVASRTKDNMVLGSWCLFDRDLVPDMPEDLVALDLDGWRAEMATLFPTLDKAAQVMVPSTSGRILIDGKSWSSKASWHLFVQVDDPDDLRNRVWAQALVKSFAVKAQGTDCPIGFHRNKYAKDGSGRIAGRQPWSIYDPTTLWPERLVFDGAPVVQGKGLTLAPPDARILQSGGRLSVDAFEDLPQELKRPAAQQGVKVERKRERAGLAVAFVTAATLDLDLELDTEDVPKTIRQLWLAGADHVRCQSPFRESSSWAAYYGVHESGEPFLFDSGADNKYVLSPTCRAGPQPEAFVEALEAWLGAIGGKVDGPAQIKDGYAFIRNAICAAVRHGWEQSAVDTLTEQLASMMAKPFGQAKTRLSSSFRRDAKRAGKAAALAAQADAGDPDEREELLQRLNERYAVVNMGGSVKIVELGIYDPCLDRKHLRVMGRADFELALANETVEVMTPKGLLRVPVAGWWLRHPDRRQHLGGITLDAGGKLGPEYLNTWQGFAVAPCEGDPSPFLEHVKVVTAGNGPDAEGYLLGWLASKVQRPGDQPETAVVLRGDMGTGKGALGHSLCRIFGGHAMHVSQPEHLVGKFNSHLLDCCFLFADEAFFAGDRHHVSVLKALITERVLSIEPKFVNAFQGRNRLGIMMASNSDFVVPAGKDERRFFVLQVPDSRKGDRGYFNRLWGAIDDPKQLGAFLRWLLDHDLSSFEIRDLPQTVTLVEQKIAALGEPERWLLNRLCLAHFPGLSVLNELKGEDGSPSGSYEWHWPTWLSTSQLYADYQQEMRSHGQPRFMLNAVTFGKFMARYFQPSRPRERGRNHGYQLGELDEARDAFAAYHGLDGFDWGG